MSADDESSEAAMSGQTDHEYEPISPPPHALPSVRVTSIEGITIQEPPEGPDAEPIMTDNDSVGSPVRKPVEELHVPYDGEDEDRAMSSGEMGDTNGSAGGPEDDAGPTSDFEEEEMSMQQIQQQMEDRFFAPTPTTPESRTDGEFNTSQMDSSGLEDLPLTREARRTATQPSTSADGSFQDRLRSGAGRLRTKIKNIKRPKMPQMQRPKFNMPSMPKRPDFHLPDRPKFKLPDRPKFSMPQRPNISLPSIASLSRGSSGSGGRSNSTKRPLRSRQFSNESTAGSPERKPMFDFDFKTYPRMFSRKAKQAREDQSSSSPKSARSATPPPRMGLGIDDEEKTRKRSIGSRWVQKFTDIKFGDDDPEHKKRKNKENEKPLEEKEKAQSTSQQPQLKGDQLVYHISLHGSESEPDYSDDQFQGPPYPELPIAEDLLVIDRAARLAALEAEEAAEAARAAEAAEAARLAAEAAREASREAAREASREAAREAARETAREAARAGASSEADEVSQSHSLDQGVESHSIPASPGDSDRENRSSGTSSERHRRGVIEEIDSDEFFLRQKGISQEDVDMTRFISSEIREALRPPASNLSRMDYGYYDDEEELENLAVHRNGGPPSRPVRTRSLRPRKKKGKRAIPATPPGDEAEEEWEDEEPSEPPTSYFNTFPPCRPQRNRRAKKKVSDDHEQDLEEQRIDESVAIHRDELGILALTPATDEHMEADLPSHPPLPPKRLRKSTTTLGHDDVPMIDDEDWEAHEHEAGPGEVSALQAEVDYIIPRAASREEVFDEPPVPPTRGRKSRSRGTSLADEDRTSRGAESLPSERDIESEIIDDIQITQRIDDYAFVDKSNARSQPTKPERPRRPKPPRPPAPGRRKRAQPPQSTASRIHSWGKQFFSLPGRRANGRQKQAPPTRPTRNYSTLGPARPPRRSGRGLRDQQVYSAYLEIQDDLSRTESHESRDLQSGDVISKMKDRPLPAPPRPPRKSREHADAEEDECTRRILQDQLLREERERDDEQELTYEERKIVLAALRNEFFSHSGEQPTTEELGEQPAPVLPAREVPQVTDVIPQESPYKSLRKKKKVPPIPVQPPPEEPAELQQEISLEARAEEVPDFSENVPPEIPPEEVSIAIQTDPLPDDMCVEDSVTVADDMSVSRTDGTTTTSTTWPTVIEADQTVAEDLPSVTAVLLGEAPEAEGHPSPPKRPERPARRESSGPQPVSTTTTVRVEIPETLRTERLQVSDLDVERLSVSELKANKITVSEIDGMSLGVSEINSKSGSLSLGGLELPSDLISQLLPVSQSLSHALSQSLSESLAQSLSHSLSHIQEALSQPTELIQQQQQLQQQLHNLQQLQREQNQQQHEQMQQQQLLHQQQLLQAEQQQAAVLQQLQQQLQQLQLQPMPQAADVPPPIPPPPRTDAQSIQTQTSLESAVPPPEPPRSYSPDYVPGAPIPLRPAPLAPPRGARPRSTALELQDSDEEIAGIVPTPSPSQSLRRRRHHTAHRVSTRYSSDEQEEDHHALAVARRHRGTVAEPTMGDVGRQLARACRASALRALAALHDAAQPALGAAGGDPPKRRELQAALCLVLILVAALILLGCGCGGSGVQHHHHWDFHFPPQF